MSYPLYAAEWHLTPAVTSSIFAVYPLVVVSTLVMFGDMSDLPGYRSTLARRVYSVESPVKLMCSHFNKSCFRCLDK
jgi:hypothetical protein